MIISTQCLLWAMHCGKRSAFALGHALWQAIGMQHSIEFPLHSYVVGTIIVHFQRMHDAQVSKKHQLLVIVQERPWVTHQRLQCAFTSEGHSHDQRPCRW